MKDIRKRIALLARARYPFIQLISHEEARVERELEKLSESENLPIWRWTTTQGLQDPNGDTVADTRSPTGMLITPPHEHACICV